MSMSVQKGHLSLLKIELVVRKRTLLDKVEKYGRESIIEYSNKSREVEK
mgnify:CR=1 FL=1